MHTLRRLLHLDISRRRLRHVMKWGITDAAIIVSCYIVSYWVRSITTDLDFVKSSAFIVFATVVTLLSLLLHGVYNRIWPQTSGHHASLLVYAVLTALPAIVLTNALISPRPLPMSVVLLSNLLVAGGLVAVRYRSRLISGLNWRWQAIWFQRFPDQPQRSRVLIVGAGESGQMMALRLKQHRSDDDVKHEVVGFIDDSDFKQQMYVEGCPVLGARRDIPGLVEEHDIDLIVVAIHNISGHDFRDILGYCERTPARIKVVPDTLALLNGSSKGAPMLRSVQPEDLIGRSLVTRHDAVDLGPVTGKVVLVTGAAGSIGSELCRQMATFDPVRLVILDNNESALHDLFIDLQTRHPDLDIIPVLADVTHRAVVCDVFTHHQPQVVFHAAAYKHVPMLEHYPHEGIRVNVTGTRHLAECARDYGVERFVLISSDKAVNPSSVMGATKRLGELILHALACQNGQRTLFAAVRFGNVLGSRGSVVPTFNRQIDNGGPVTITDASMTRYFMSIAEAVNLVIHAACLTNGDDIFVLRMGEVVRIMDIAERMIRLRGLRPHVDIPIRVTGTRPGEKLHEELYDESEGPEPTIHPHIIKLNTWTASFDADGYLHQVEQLTAGRTPDAVALLNQLVHFAEPHYNQAAD